MPTQPFAVFSDSTGEIIRVGRCSPGSIDLQSGDEGESIHPLDDAEIVRTDTHFIWTDPLTDEKFVVAYPPKPTANAVFDFATQTWGAGDIEELRNVARRTALDMFRKVRLDFVTVLPGQDLIYDAKKSEATAFLAATPVPTDLTDYPFIAGEVGTSSGATALAVALTYQAASNSLKLVGAALEAPRIVFGDAVSAATTAAEIDLALATLVATLDALAST